jgi:hypothetical protein
VQPHFMASGTRGRHRLLLVRYGCCCFHRSMRIDACACMARTWSRPAQFIDTWMDDGVDRRRRPQGTGGVRKLVSAEHSVLPAAIRYVENK